MQSFDGFRINLPHKFIAHKSFQSVFGTTRDSLTFRSNFGVRYDFHQNWSKIQGLIKKKKFNFDKIQILDGLSASVPHYSSRALENGSNRFLWNELWKCQTSNPHKLIAKTTSKLFCCWKHNRINQCDWSNCANAESIEQGKR